MDKIILDLKEGSMLDFEWMEGTPEKLRLSPTLRKIFLELLPRLRKDLSKIAKELGGLPPADITEIRRAYREMEREVKKIDREKTRIKSKPRK